MSARADGRHLHHGRADRQVKLRGFRIELEEVEAAMAALGGVSSVAAVTDKDRLGALYAGPMSVEAVRAGMLEAVPAYMVPSIIELAAQLPRLPNQKVDYASVTAMLFGKAPPPVAEAAGPLSATEQIVAAVFSAILDVETVAPTDNFFALGGHSLLATRALARLRRETTPSLTLKTFFMAETVSTLAAAIDELMAGEEAFDL